MTWNLGLVLQIFQKIFERNFFAYIYQLATFVDLMSCGSKDIFKMHSVSCANIYHDVTDLINHGMVKKPLNTLITEHNFSTK